MEIPPELKPRIIHAIDSLMKNLSIPDCGINLDDPEVKNMLSQKKGGFYRQNLMDSGKRMDVNVRWNKPELLFACSIAFLEKQQSEKWKCVARFDDAHDCRHLDVDFPAGKTKMFGGRFVEAKIQCPLLIQMINSLPKERAEEWKIKLFKEVVVGNERWQEYLNDVKNGKSRIWH